jgi:ParB-like chromosome segregation protein Spo0J
MGKSLDEVMAALPADRRRRVEARAGELVAEEMTLRELRKAMGKTQAQLARRLGKPQATISRMEAQSDMLLSTLGQVVEGLGGRVRVVAELPGRPPVALSLLSDLGPTKRRTAPDVVAEPSNAQPAGIVAAHRDEAMPPDVVVVEPDDDPETHTRVRAEPTSGGRDRAERVEGTLVSDPPLSLARIEAVRRS